MHGLMASCTELTSYTCTLPVFLLFRAKCDKFKFMYIQYSMNYSGTSYFSYFYLVLLHWGA